MNFPAFFWSINVPWQRIAAHPHPPLIDQSAASILIDSPITPGRNSAKCHCLGAQCREPRKELKVERRVLVVAEPRLLLSCRAFAPSDIDASAN